MSSNTIQELLALVSDKTNDLSKRKQAFLDIPIVAASAPDADPRIPLTEKKIPTAENKHLTESTAWVKCYAENLPISELQARLREGEAQTPNIWSSDGQKTNDLSETGLKRPYHDGLGVGKIIFKFTDDLLTQCFELPWWEEWEQLYFRPIFTAIGIRSDQVVRCLLARMPSDCLIDVHHDTGRWTHVTHRMHVPIFTHPPSVAFLSGRTPETMLRYDFVEGACYELNNRAKHAVYNSWEQPRVHLIFDWIEATENVQPAIVHRLLNSTEHGVVQHRRAMWFYNDQAEYDQLPELDSNHSLIARKSAFKQLVALANDADAEATLTRLILATDQGELLLSEARTALAQSFPAVALSSEFIKLFATCLSDPERRFSCIVGKDN